MKLYHSLKEIAIAAAEFAAMIWFIVAVMTGYCTACIGLYAMPSPDWYAFGVRFTLGAPLSALIIALAACAVRYAVQARKPVRFGVIGAETICRALEGKR